MHLKIWLIIGKTRHQYESAMCTWQLVLNHLHHARCGWFFPIIQRSVMLSLLSCWWFKDGLAVIIPRVSAELTALPKRVTTALCFAWSHIQQSSLIKNTKKISSFVSHYKVYFVYRYTKGVDIWSLGTILAEMLRGRPLFTGENTIEQINFIRGALNEPTTDGKIDIHPD